MEATGDANVVMLTLTLMPNLSHGGEDMDTEVVEDTGVANDALPRLILCHGDMVDITEDTGDKKKRHGTFIQMKMNHMNLLIKLLANYLVL